MEEGNLRPFILRLEQAEQKAGPGLWVPPSPLPVERGRLGWGGGRQLGPEIDPVVGQASLLGRRLRRSLEGEQAPSSEGDARSQERVCRKRQ